MEMKTLVICDDYGNKDYSKFLDEIDYFIKKVVRINTDYFVKAAACDDYDADQGLVRLSDDEKYQFYETISLRVADAVDAVANVNDASDEFSGDDPIDFEVWCVDKLIDNGWVAYKTPNTGDQGADVIAEKDGVRIAVQCKCYSVPVGNKSVQEVAASLLFYGADYGAVVTTSSYTKSAKALAQSNGVKLLHHTDLVDFDLVKLLD